MFKKLRRWLVNVKYSRFGDITYAIRNWIFRRHNKIHLTKFSGKDWIETDQRLFEAVFECLREFVEDQKAWMHVVFDPDRRTKLEYWKMRYLPNRFRRKLSRELAFKHLDWEMTVPTCGGDITVEGSQAQRAKQIKELYIWYMDVYNKNDPWDAVDDPPGGIRNLFRTEPIEWDEDGNPTMFRMLSNDGPEWEEYRKQADAAMAETDRRYKEATEKAIEVLKIRDSLWT